MRDFPESKIALQGQRLRFNITGAKHAADPPGLQRRAWNDNLRHRVPVQGR
jgi:hypothetical protein